jgi:hypothetical protein
MPWVQEPGWARDVRVGAYAGCKQVDQGASVLLLGIHSHLQAHDLRSPSKSFPGAPSGL